MRRVYPVFGIVAAVSYILYVVIGGFISEGGYSHLVNAISELSYFVQKDKYIYLSKLSDTYTISLLFFSIIAFIDFKRYKSNLCRIAFILLLLNGISGMMMTFFPMDARGSQTTFDGTVHLVLAGLCAIFSILPPFLAGLGFKKIPKFKHLSVFSIISSVIIFFSGGITAAGAANQIKYFGIFERITIGTYIVWILVISIQIFFINLKSSELKLT